MKQRYKRYFKENLSIGALEKVINIFCMMLGKKIGQKVYPAFMLDYVMKQDEGKLEGIIATTSGGQQLRFNFKPGKYKSIISINIWNSIKVQPDLTIQTEGRPLQILMRAVVFALKDGIPGEMVLEENVAPQTGGKVSKDIANSITEWSNAMSVDENKLTNTRMNDLYKDYQYWYSEISDGSYKLVPQATFRNYLLKYFEKYGIQNIFMRKVTITSSGKEKSLADKKETKEFDDTIYELSLADKMDFIQSSVFSVTRGYENALIIAGQAGIGKSTIVKDSLKRDGKKAKWIQGDLKNYGALYKLFYDNKDSLLVFDDSDFVFKKQYLGIMNAALAPEKDRIMSYPAEFGKELPKGYADEFEFTGQVLIITNMPKKKIPASLISRGAVIEVKVNPQEVMDYIRMNINKVMPEYPQATSEIKIQVLDFLESRGKLVTQIDFRLFKRVVIHCLSGNPNWKKFAIPIVNSMK